jgi:N-acetylglucosaminyldiphosphoundecaprenol N-acetyl-beta-D-mannosaminyltransferase
MGGHVCVTGAHGVVFAQDDAEFKSILNSATMNTLDGQPVVWIARSRGYDVSRVTGRELVWDVVDLDANNKIRHVFFGATALVTDRMVALLNKRRGNIRIEVVNPPFGPLDDGYLDPICTSLGSDEPTIIWVGLSTPKQEHLAVRLSKRLPKAPIVAIGAGFDFVAELKQVAPQLMTSLGLEWLFRLASEPRRLFRRYAEVVPRFLGLIVHEWLKSN